MKWKGLTKTFMVSMVFTKNYISVVRNNNHVIIIPLSSKRLACTCYKKANTSPYEGVDLAGPDELLGLTEPGSTLDVRIWKR